MFVCRFRQNHHCICHRPSFTIRSGLSLSTLGLSTATPPNVCHRLSSNSLLTFILRWHFLSLEITRPTLSLYCTNHSTYSQPVSQAHKSSILLDSHNSSYRNYKIYSMKLLLLCSGVRDHLSKFLYPGRYLAWKGWEMMRDDESNLIGRCPKEMSDDEKHGVYDEDGG